MADTPYARSKPDTYDTIGRGYANLRVPDPRIGAQIGRALGDARRICNVGAGAGSYEPLDREVVAVEPSRAMIAQRAKRRVVRAQAEALPFADRSFDAATAFLTVHHWQDVAAGIAELKRIAPLRVIFTFDPTRVADLWLVRDYLPEVQQLDRSRAPTIERLVELLGGADVSTVPIPWDCSDGFQGAYWRRPERYLEPAVRASISTFAMLPDAVVARGMARLAADLASGAWAARNAELLQRDHLDLAYRLIVSREP
jgi:hypothetical protein